MEELSNVITTRNGKVGERRGDEPSHDKSESNTRSRLLESPSAPEDPAAEGKEEEEERGGGGEVGRGEEGKGPGP